MLVVPLRGALAQQCGPFTFGALSIQDRGRSVERALARVYAPGTKAMDRHKGAAIVVRVTPMLLLTASHVVREETAQVSFPSLNDGRLYQGKVIARAIKNQSSSLSDAAEEGHDFAVLSVENPPVTGVNSLELWFEQVEKDEDHDVAGYGRDTPNPIWGKGRLAEHTECAWRLREPTFNGDSGGAAVSQSGLLVGIITEGREGGQLNNANGQATILPLNCVRDTILAALDSVAPPGGPNILDADRAILTRQLQPPASSGWIDNLNFVRGLRDLMQDRPLLRQMKARDALFCPLFKSTLDRKLGFRIAAQLIELASENAKEAGNAFKGIGDRVKIDNEVLAKRLYASAADSYEEYMRLKKPTFPTEGSLVPASWDVAQAALGRAQALLSIAEINTQPPIIDAAIGAAVQAINATTKGGQRALAYALLGNSAFKQGDYQTAIEAYSSASRNGLTARWITNSYAEAFRRRDNISRPDVASDYAAIGIYPGLDDGKLLTLASRNPTIPAPWLAETVK